MLLDTRTHLHVRLVYLTFEYLAVLPCFELKACAGGSVTNDDDDDYNHDHDHDDRMDFDMADAEPADPDMEGADQGDPDMADARQADLDMADAGQTAPGTDCGRNSSAANSPQSLQQTGSHPQQQSPKAPAWTQPRAPQVIEDIGLLGFLSDTQQQVKPPKEELEKLLPGRYGSLLVKGSPLTIATALEGDTASTILSH